MGVGEAAGRAGARRRAAVPWIAAFVVLAVAVYLVLPAQRDEELFNDPYYWLGFAVHAVLVVTVLNGSRVGWGLLAGSSALALLWWLAGMGSDTYDVVCAVLLAAALAVLFGPPLLRYVWREPASDPADGA